MQLLFFANRAVLSCALALVSTLCLGTGVFEDEWNGNAHYWSSIDGFDPGAKVSGTNVNLPFGGGIALMVTEDPVWTSVQLLSVTVNLTGMDEPQTLYPNIPNNGTLSRTLRFASTHYSPSEPEVTVEVTANVAFSNGVTSSTDSVTCTLTLEAYNRGLVLATKEDFDGVATYTVNTPPNPQGYAENAINAMPEAKSKLQAMKHTLLNPGGNHFLRESDLASDGSLDAATACFFFTHGNPGYFRASEIDELHFEFNNGSSEVQSYVLVGRTVPTPNLIVMHACCTLSGSGYGQWHAPYAFGTCVTLGQYVPGKSYSGFTAPVWSLTTGGTLTQHAQYIYDKLSQGWTLYRAVTAANLAYTPKSSTALHMVIRGDHAAKLIGVYTGNEEANNTNWWVIL